MVTGIAHLAVCVHCLSPLLSRAALPAELAADVERKMFVARSCVAALSTSVI